MLKDLTLGQYYPEESPIHRLDPRVKLAGTLVFIITLFFGQSVWLYLGAFLYLLIVIRLSRVPLRYIVRGLKTIVVLILLSALFNLFLTPGDILVKLGPLTITTQGLVTAIFMVVRLIFLIMGSSILTLTTTPNQLTDGMERGLSWLKIFRVPVHEIAMMMTIALRFIPILVDETDKIIKAQKARGADFESGNIMQRARAMIPILVPLFISAFRRANDLAMAMEARCYHGSEGRTRMKPLVYTKNDRLAYLGLALYFALMLAIFITLGSRVI
ncbi:MAG: energy-coupling factor transporter transmembrane component T [Lachnospira sp.]|nr:energy-coupling factor transporter transmembrane component T [Lachnospira sp.]